MNWGRESGRRRRIDWTVPGRIAVIESQQLIGRHSLPYETVNYEKRAMKICCSCCGTVEFVTPGRSFQFALGCPTCRLVMCIVCVGREVIDGGMEAFCCYQCRSRRLFRIDVAADLIDWPPSK